MSRRENEHIQNDLNFGRTHGALSATTTYPIFKARRRCRVVRVEYDNPTGLAGDPANAFKGELKVGANVVSTLFNTENDNGGATLVAGALLTPAIVSTYAVLEQGDTLNAVYTKIGTGALPADGQVRVIVTEL